MIPTVFTASKGLEIFYSEFIASTFVLKTVSSTDETSKQAKLRRRQNFHFHLDNLSPTHLGWKLVLRQAGQSTAHKWLKINPSKWKLSPTASFQKRQFSLGYPHLLEIFLWPCSEGWSWLGNWEGFFYRSRFPLQNKNKCRFIFINRRKKNTFRKLPTSTYSSESLVED